MYYVEEALVKVVTSCEIAAVAIIKCSLGFGLVKVNWIIRVAAAKTVVKKSICILGGTTSTPIYNY